MPLPRRRRSCCIRKHSVVLLAHLLNLIRRAAKQQRNVSVVSCLCAALALLTMSSFGSAWRAFMAKPLGSVSDGAPLSALVVAPQRCLAAFAPKPSHHPMLLGYREPFD
jgi:hypothetical protein